MKRKALSLLLSLTLVFSLALPATTAYADDSSDSGMKISKTATANTDGSYTVTLEAYATGEKVISTVKEDVPTDIILVLDQSGSMADDIGTVSYQQYKDESSWSGTTYHTRNQDYYEYRHNGGSANLWYEYETGKYASVSVTVTGVEISYIKEGVNDYTNSDLYRNYRNNLYAKIDGTDEPVKVTVTREYDWDTYTYAYTYTYTKPNGDVVTVTSNANWATSGITDTLWIATGTDYSNAVYTYTCNYTDSTGASQTKTLTSTGGSTVFTPAFYKRVDSSRGGGSRLAALKSAASAFAEAVAKKAAGEDGDISTTADNVNHRIAVVGYADTDSRYGYNTGVFIGSTLNRYGTAASGVYATALQDMSTTNGKNNVTASINALKSSGATRIDYGLTMANGILNANPVPQGETRNRVVIVFTDGSPTDSNGFETSVANSAISAANTIKTGGTTVYSIGIFSGANASSAGTKPNRDLSDGSSEFTAACNWFMQNVSSNNGTPQSPSYYLSASDSASLNNIFQQISQQIETGGSSSTLTEETVVKDIISPYFTLPEGATADSITLKTYKYNGTSFDAANAWTENTGDTMGAKVTVDGDKVNVTGFNFSKNWCGTESTTGKVGDITYRGNKLVISFTVQPKSGFLGGNDVPTNTSAGIYENSSATTPVMTFEQPTVNVPINDVTVTATDMNVYLLSDVTAEQIQSGTTVKVGSVELDLSKAADADKPYGLEKWQTEYVDITVTVKDKDGNAIPAEGLKALTDDTTYTIEVTVAPKTDGTASKGTPAAAKSGKNDPAANINVFKPELTFKDSTAYYGDTAPADFSGNLTDTVWKHGDTKSTDSGVTMIGTEPKLDITYTAAADKISDGKINTKQDFAVDVAVKIGTADVTEKTTFVHTKCTGDTTCTDPTDGKFWIHVKTCTLSITKQGGADNESYVFDVYKDGVKYSEVTVWGNGTETIVELPVGSYTIAENTGWSWRYSADNGSAASLSATSPTGSITCTNSSNGNIYWLNGFSQVVRNIFDGND